MSRRRTLIVMVLLSIVCLVVLIRHDIATLARIRAERRFQANDYSGARDEWNLALKLHSGDIASRFNRGVAQYRLGNYAAARDDFSAAGDSSDRQLRQQALYNQGNSLVRLAEQNAAAAEKLYQSALDCYRKALTLKPEDRDARANLAIADAARSAMLAAQGSRLPDARHPPGTDAKTDSEQRRTAEKKDDFKSAKANGKNGQTTDDDQSENGHKRKTMGREQAERLLNEKWGQEALPSSILATPGGKSAAPPLQDW